MTRQVVDLFSGTGSATAAFRDSPDWTVTEVDCQHQENAGPDEELSIEPDLPVDVMDLEPWMLPSDVDVVWASPPCTTMSRMSNHHHWHRPGVPATAKAERHAVYAKRAVRLIHELEPEYWFLENPVGMMKHVLAPLEPRIVHYCQYGHDSQKPTYLFGEHPPGLEYRTCQRGDDCHIKSERGANTGTQSASQDAVSRSMVPRELSDHILEAIEHPAPRQSSIMEAVQCE